MFLEEFDEFADVLGLIAVEDEEGVGSVDDDEVLDAEQGDEFTGGIDVAAGGILKEGIGAGGIAGGIVLLEFVDGAPGADIIPAEFRGGDADDGFFFFEDGVVDGDVLAEGEDAGELGVEIGVEKGG